MKRTTMTLALAALLLVAVGCEQRIADFTVISTRNVDLSRMGEYQKGATRVRGKDWIPIIVIFRDLRSPDLKLAVDAALNDIPGGVALIDGVIYKKNWWLVFGEDSLIIEGTPLIDPKVVPVPTPPE